MKTIFLYLFLVTGYSIAQNIKPTFGVYFNEMDSVYYFQSNLDTNEFFISKLILTMEGGPTTYESNSDKLNEQQINILLKYPLKKGTLKIIYYSNIDRIWYFTGLEIN